MDKKAEYIRDIKSFLIRLAVIIVILWITFGYIFGFSLMRDNSMFPRVSAGDLLLYYRLDKEYLAGDVLIYQKEGKSRVGRVIAKPNDKVEIRQSGELVINDSIVLENNVFYKTMPYGDKVAYPLQLSDNEYFVLCDFREGPQDSRLFGAVKRSEIKGKIFTILRRSEL